MTQKEAKIKIIALWDAQPKNSLTRTEILAFWGYLQNNHPDLLKFNYKGNDKYTKVKSWVLPYTGEPLPKQTNK